MEIDTGAAVSVISETNFKKLWPTGSITLKDTNAYLCTYTGERVAVIGTCDVNVSSMGTKAVLPLIVVPGTHSTLLGRNWLTRLPVDWGPLKQVRYSTLENVVQQHPQLFDEGLGTIKGTKARVFLNEGTAPKYFKARAVPFAIRDKVEQELQRLQESDIIFPVEFSEWATPIVPVVKGDGTIRICGNYKVTLNDNIKVDKYPLPQIDDLLTKLAGGKCFTKLDMSHAYQQIELEADSKEFFTINTHKGILSRHDKI